MKVGSVLLGASLVAQGVPSAEGLRGSPSMQLLQVPSSRPVAVLGDRASLAMNLAAGVPTLEVKINGQGPFRLAFDTAAPGGPHLSDRLANILGLQPAGKMIAGDPSGTNAIPLRLYRLKSVEFGSVFLKEWTATAAPTRPGNAEAWDGVVGLSAFSGFVVTMDYSHGRFSLRRGALPVADGKSVFSYKGQMAPAVSLTVEGRTILAHVDTGNSVAGIIVPATFANGLHHRSEAEFSGEAHTLSNTVKMYSVPIDGHAHVGATRLAASAVGYPSIIPVANVGSLALVQSVVEVDPANERIRIIASKH